MLFDNVFLLVLYIVIFWFDCISNFFEDWMFFIIWKVLFMFICCIELGLIVIVWFIWGLVEMGDLMVI